LAPEVPGGKCRGIGVDKANAALKQSLKAIDPLFEDVDTEGACLLSCHSWGAEAEA